MGSKPSKNSEDTKIAAALAVSTGTVVGALYQIPNEHTVFAADPLQKSRTEDSIIAYTWCVLRVCVCVDFFALYYIRLSFHPLTNILTYTTLHTHTHTTHAHTRKHAHTTHARTHTHTGTTSSKTHLSPCGYCASPWSRLPSEPWTL